MTTEDRTIYRLSYARDEAACWIAHLDLMRLFERTIQRAGLPVGWSGGFNPRPALTFALPVGMGIETRQDWFELELTEQLPPETVSQRLNQALPPGFSVADAAQITRGKKSLMSLVYAAEYRIEAEGIARAAEQLLADGEPVVVSWHKKKHQRTADIRPLIDSWQVGQPDQLTCRVRAGSEQNLRPDRLLQALVDRDLLTQDQADDSRIIRLRVLLAGQTG